MRVQSLSQEDPLKEEMATLSNITAWRNLVGYSPVDHKESGLTKVTEHACRQPAFTSRNVTLPVSEDLCLHFFPNTFATPEVTAISLLLNHR